MIERVGKEFPTLFICVRERVGLDSNGLRHRKKSGKLPPFTYFISLDVPD